MKDERDAGRILRPMGYGGLVNEAFHLYKQNFVLFAGVAALAWAPYWFLWTVAPIESEDVGGLLVVLLFALTPFVYTAEIGAIANRYLDLPASVWGSWRRLLRRLGPLLLTAVMAWIAVGCGLALLFVPGIYLYARSFFLPHVMLVENRSYLEALRRTHQLSEGQVGRILVVSLLMLLLASPFPALLTYPGLQSSGDNELPTAGSPEGWHLPGAADLLVALSLTALVALPAPLPTALGVLLYFDTRIRKEGFDIEWLSRSIDPAPPPRPQAGPGCD